MARPIDCTCTCGGYSRHWLPIEGGLVHCEVVGCDCKVKPDDLCLTCGRGFLRPQGQADDIHICYSCSQQDFYEQTNRRFSPLTDTLAAHGIKAEPTNTGGHVMCLWVDLPVITLPNGKTHTPYVLFSDEAEQSGAGVYLGDDTTGLWLDSPEPDDQPNAGWHARLDGEGPTLGERTGEWFARLWPDLCRWVTSEVTFTSESRHVPAYSNLPAHDYEDVTAAFDSLPVLPDTAVGRC